MMLIGEETNSQGEVRWALCCRMYLKDGWEKQPRFASERDLPDLLPVFIASLNGSVFSWLTHSSKDPSRSGGRSHLRSQPNHCRAQVPSTNPTSHPHLSTATSITEKPAPATQPTGPQTSPGNSCLAQLHALLLAARP